MNKPRPLPPAANPDEVLDELVRMRLRHQNDAQRHLQEAERIDTLHACLRERFVADNKKGKKT